MKVHFLSVGNGDCTLIELPDNKLMMVDIINAKLIKHIDKYINPILSEKFKTKRYGNLWIHTNTSGLGPYGRTSRPCKALQYY